MANGEWGELEMKELFDYLDGKKTTIGSIVWFVALVIGQAQNYFGFHVIDNAVIEQAQHAAEVIVGVGLGHKLIKRV